jgi:hypothetical protein
MLPGTPFWASRLLGYAEHFPLGGSEARPFMTSGGDDYLINKLTIPQKPGEWSCLIPRIASFAIAPRGKLMAPC